MVRFLFLAALVAIAAGAIAWVAGRLSGRPVVDDTVGKILVALVVAGLALVLFGGGWLWN
jgi:VIT1/CCC1 family predicted Fe2+/Mn2+ transporter